MVRAATRRAFVRVAVGALALGTAVATLGLGLACRQTPPTTEAAGGHIEAAIAEIEAGRKTTPLIGEPTTGGEVTVTFLARRVDGRAPRVVSDVTGWGDRPDGTFDVAVGTMQRVGRTEWYSLEARVAPGARIEYLLAYGPAAYRPDPNNPRQAPHVGADPASEFVTPGHVPPPELTEAPVTSTGQVAKATIESRALGEERDVVVYTPPGYRRNGDYPVAVFHDHGGGRLLTGEVPRVLDWLIARGAIVPIVMVSVDPDTSGEYRRAPMHAFVGRELLAWLSARYGVTTSADRRAIIAVSYSARSALDAAVSTGAFGLLGLLIPGHVIGRAELGTIAPRGGRRLRVAIVGSRYDAANVETARSLRRAFLDAGDVVDYVEVPEGHNQAAWRTHLRTVLVSLFGTR